MELWAALLDILILLLGAMVLGALFERIGQSSILGYLLAGTLLGPNALDLMPNHEAIGTIAELGLALLLFTIGLEFSWRRLRSLGTVALGGGALQVLVTMVFAAGAAALFGVGWRPAVAVGAMIALSSTACVLRLLTTRREMDSVHGRFALGILLMQDIAVVPLVLIVTALGAGGDGGSLGSIGIEIGRSVLLAALLVGALIVLLGFVLPRVLGSGYAARNREFSVLLAIVTPLATAWCAHKLGLSPVLGAFIAGIVLGESPFAAQVSADVMPLRSLFVTLFFGSIGMLADPGWVIDHWPLLAGATAAVIVAKTLITAGIVRLFRATTGPAIATGLCLAQVGEFSFVLAEVAGRGGLLGGDLREFVIALTIATLFLTPLLVGLGPRVGAAVTRREHQARAGPPDGDETEGDHLILVGFGPCGRLVAEALLERGERSPLVIELNARASSVVRAYGLRLIIGDGTAAEVLEHARVQDARGVIITIPDPTAAGMIVRQVRAIAPSVPLVVRARMHAFHLELVHAGATVVVDEEQEVGRQMASAIGVILGEQKKTPNGATADTKGSRENA